MSYSSSPTGTWKIINMLIGFLASSSSFAVTQHCTLIIEVHERPSRRACNTCFRAPQPQRLFLSWETGIVRYVSACSSTWRPTLFFAQFDYCFHLTFSSSSFVVFALFVRGNPLWCGVLRVASLSFSATSWDSCPRCVHVLMHSLTPPPTGRV